MLPSGPHALLIECADAAEVAAWHAALRADPDRLPPGAELVPGARTVLVDHLPDPDALAARLTGSPTSWSPTARTAPAAPGPLVTIPCAYDGPDLAEVADLWRTSPEGVVRRHTGTEFRVAFCGFSPGFGYLTGLDADHAVPRRSSPRPRVPAGSVGLAGEYTGVYPSESPGGWQLIGRTDVVLFDPAADPPALLTPGTRVRFEEVSR